MEVPRANAEECRSRSASPCAADDDDDEQNDEHVDGENDHDWFSLRGIDLYLQKHVGDANRKSCLRVISKLITGQGVAHKSKPEEVFAEGRVIRPSDDLEALRLQAGEWLPYSSSDPNCLDKGHGWALNHPIQKLINYKRDCLGDNALVDDDDDNDDDDNDDAENAKAVPPPEAEAPTAATSKKRKATDVLDLSTSCNLVQKMLNDIPEFTNKIVREVTKNAQEFIEKKAEEGKLSVEAPVVFLGRVPELANIPHEMTTAQVQTYLKDKFKAMTPAQFARGFYGIEAYFMEHPRGVEKGYVAKQGWLSVDHVIAQYFGMFHHPRFYALLSPEVNAHLRDSPPITRVGFGIKRHEMVDMHNWMKHMEAVARKKKLQDMLLTSLVESHPVHSLK